MTQHNRVQGNILIPTKRFATAIAGLLLLCETGFAPAFAAGPMDETAMRNATTLYTQQKYAAAADAFESLIRASTPNARLYYYAAAASRGSNRIARAKQLCHYIVANFPLSTEASYAQKMFPELGGAGTPAATNTALDLPDSLKNKKIEELMQTEEGRKALKEALSKQKTATSPSTVAASAGTGSNRSAPSKKSDAAFTATDIAIDGANGITDFGYGGGSFECCLSAMASLPRGQKMLAEMIRSVDGKGTYIVRFPNDTVEHLLTPQKIESCEVRDKATWATLIHCGDSMNQNNRGGLEGDLSALTGKKAEKINPKAIAEPSLNSFIRDALKEQNPIVCESGSDFGTLPGIVETGQAYTITDFDPASGMITLRNPHGANSRRFRMKEDPDHKKFEQLNEGMLRLHISLFPRYFDEVVRASL